MTITPPLSHPFPCLHTTHRPFLQHPPHVINTLIQWNTARQVHGGGQAYKVHPKFFFFLRLYYTPMSPLLLAETPTHPPAHHIRLPHINSPTTPLMPNIENTPRRACFRCSATSSPIHMPDRKNTPLGVHSRGHIFRVHRLPHAALSPVLMPKT